jgi:hypothetical protein
VRHISNTAREGMMAGKPKGYEGAVNKQFQGDQTMNKLNNATGTPYDSRNGNSDEFTRTVSQSKYGMVRDVNGDQNNPADNGSGVILDGITREDGYSPMSAETMDSPVVRGAPALDTRSIRAENIAHLGQGIGASPSQAGDDILAIEGVMSRGTQGTSHPNEGPDELAEDDVLRNLGRGGAVG